MLKCHLFLTCDTFNVPEMTLPEFLKFHFFFTVSCIVVYNMQQNQGLFNNFTTVTL